MHSVGPTEEIGNLKSPYDLKTSRGTEERNEEAGEERKVWEEDYHGQRLQLQCE
jgi:hypothetical protein